MKKTLVKSLLLCTVLLSSIGTASIVLSENTEEVASTVENSVTYEDSTSSKVDIQPSETYQTDSKENDERRFEPSTTTVKKSKGDENLEVTVQEYTDNVADFKNVNFEEVRKAFTEDNLEHTLLFSRGTCPHCRQFSPILKEFNTLINGKLEYYNVDGEDFNDQAKEFLFKTIQIPGTPTVLHLKNGQLLSGWAGGGLTAQQLYDYLYLGRSPEQPKVEKKSEENTDHSTSLDTKKKLQRSTKSEARVETIVPGDKVLNTVTETLSGQENKNIRSQYLSIFESKVTALDSRDTPQNEQNSPETYQYKLKLSNVAQNVSTTSKESSLPKTGEKQAWSLVYIGQNFLILALAIVFTRLIIKQEE